MNQPASIRREYVDRAVAFLASDAVKQDLNNIGGNGRSREFLRSMGLSSEEIETAFYAACPLPPVGVLPVTMAPQSFPSRIGVVAPIATAATLASGGLSLLAVAAVGALAGFAWTYFDVPKQIRVFLEPEGYDPSNPAHRTAVESSLSLDQSFDLSSPQPLAPPETVSAMTNAEPSAILEAHRGAFREALEGARAAERDNMAAVHELRALVAALNSSIAQASDDTRRQQRLLDGSLQAVASDVAALRRDLSMTESTPAAKHVRTPFASSILARSSSDASSAFQFSTPLAASTATVSAASAVTWPAPLLGHLPIKPSLTAQHVVPCGASEAPATNGANATAQHVVIAETLAAAAASEIAHVNALVVDSVSQVDARCLAAQASVAALIGQNTLPALEFAAPFITMVIGNIIAHPETPRYRKLASSNDSFRKSIVSLQGHKVFLEALGFCEDASTANWKWVHTSQALPSLMTDADSKTDVDVSAPFEEAEALQALAAAKDAFVTGLQSLRTGAAVSPAYNAEPAAVLIGNIVPLASSPVTAAGAFVRGATADSVMLTASEVVAHVPAVQLEAQTSTDNPAVNVAGAVDENATSVDTVVVDFAAAEQNGGREEHSSPLPNADLPIPCPALTPSPLVEPLSPATAPLIVERSFVNDSVAAASAAPPLDVAPAWTSNATTVPDPASGPTPVWTTVSGPPPDLESCVPQLSYAEVIRYVAAGLADELPGVRSIDEALSAQALELGGCVELQGAPPKPWLQAKVERGTAAGDAQHPCSADAVPATAIALALTTPVAVPSREQPLTCAWRTARSSWSAATPPTQRLPPSSRSPWLPSTPTPQHSRSGSTRNSSNSSINRRAASAPACVGSAAVRGPHYHCSNPVCPRHRLAVASPTPTLDDVRHRGISFSSGATRRRLQLHPLGGSAAPSQGTRTAIAAAIAAMTMQTPPPMVADSFATPAMAVQKGRDTAASGRVGAASRAALSAAAATLPTAPFVRHAQNRAADSFAPSFAAPRSSDETLDSHGSPVVQFNWKGRAGTVATHAASASSSHAPGKLLPSHPATIAAVAVDREHREASTRATAPAVQEPPKPMPAVIMVHGSPVPRTRTFREALLAAANPAPELLRFGSATVHSGTQ